VAAASLRDAGLHPLVLGRDPLAQLLQPQGSARLLVPEEELEAAQQLLGSGAEGPEAGRLRAAAGNVSAAATVTGLLMLLAAYLVPASLPFVIVLFALWLFALRRLRRRAEE